MGSVCAWQQYLSPLSSYNQYTGQHCTLSSMYLVVNDDGDEELRIVIGVSCNG